MFLRIVREFGEANKELWLFLMMFGIVAMLNYVVASDRMMLGFLCPAHGVFCLPLRPASRDIDGPGQHLIGNPDCALESSSVQG